MIIAVTVWIIAFSAAYADRNVNLELDSVYSAQEQQPDNDLNTKYGWTNQAEFDAHLIVAPSMNLGSENFQPDALFDIFITRETGTNSFVTALREAYVDLLFYNSLSIKGGFVRLDYGALNSWYNPLNIVQLLNLQSVYQQIMIGNARQGYEGLPDIQASYSFPEFITDFKLSIEEDMICTGLTNFNDNSFISKIEGIYGNIDLALLMGYSPESWDTGNTNRFQPVFGSSLSIRFPYDIMFFGEAIYRSQSFRPIVSNNNVLTSITGNYFDTSVKLSYTFKEPLFNNAINTSLEYFHYGEGMTASQYDDSYDYFTNTGMMNALAMGFYRMDGDFQDYLYFTASYTLIVPRISISYLLDAELESGYLQHTLTIAKNYDTVTITASFVYNQSPDQKYSLTFFDQDFAFYLEALISI
jgi:hypothetical protein